MTESRAIPAGDLHEKRRPAGKAGMRFNPGACEDTNVTRFWVFQAKREMDRAKAIPAFPAGFVFSNS
jgi:hypothetical protein